jgi:diguanylate cyclase (GGDEF)-like protein
MTFEQKVIFEKLVASLPKLQLRLKEQLGALIKLNAISLSSEVDHDLQKNPAMEGLQQNAPIIVPWRGKYLLIHYATLTPWDDHQQKNLGFVLINQIIKNVLLEWENDYLEMMIYQDDLTNVFNYRRLCEDLEIHLKKDRVFTLAFFDIDDLKKINEKFGHFVGSRIIKFIAQKLYAELGKTYHLYRYGGDEFVCLFDQLTTTQVKPALDKVVTALETEPYLTEQGISIAMGISVGVAEFPKDGKTMKDIIDLADKMMFCAKKDGKNKVINKSSQGKKAA